MPKVILKTIKTPGHHYVYDRNTNSIFRVTPEEFGELQKVENHELSHIESAVVGKYQESGYLKESTLKEIEHPRTKYVKYLTGHQLKQLILQVTQNCNLRCAYCAYSGHYRNRKHTGARMNWSTAKKAIDYFVVHSDHLEKVYIGFYGGEPLLELDLIKQCVEYVETEYAERKIEWNITTNATLLTDEAVKFLSRHRFMVQISLDGPKEFHDINRRFQDGRGSFDIIEKRLIHIRENYPEFYRGISINTVVDTAVDLQAVHEFYQKDALFGRLHTTINGLASNYAKEQWEYQEKDIVFQKYEKFKVLLYMIGKITSGIRPHFFRREVGSQEKFAEGLYTIKELPEKHHHGGPCVPGADKLFVSCDGSFFPCERVSEESDFMRIGNVDEGIQYDQVLRLLNFGRLTAEECKECWNLLHCMICPAEVDGLTEFSKERNLAICAVKKKEIIEQLKCFCLLKEQRYEFGKEVD